MVVPLSYGGDSINWIVENLTNALQTWNNKLAEIWGMIAQSPQTFKGGAVWSVMVSINGGLKAIGYGLLVLFTAIAIFGGTMNVRELRRPEAALRYFIRFVAAKTAVGYCMDLMLLLFEIGNGVMSKVAEQMGSAAAALTLPDEIVNNINSLGFLESIPLWIITLIGSLAITVISFVLVMTVYGRFFRLYMYTAVAPIPLSCFAGEGTSQHGKQFIRNYVAVCLEGAVVMLALIIFSALTGTAPALAAGSAVTKVYAYIAEMVFNMLILVGLVKGSDRISKELFGI